MRAASTIKYHFLTCLTSPCSVRFDVLLTDTRVNVFVTECSHESFITLTRELLRLVPNSLAAQWDNGRGLHGLSVGSKRPEHNAVWFLLSEREEVEKRETENWFVKTRFLNACYYDM